MFYGGISKEEYSTISPEIFKSNIKNILFFSGLGVLAYLFLCVVDTFSELLTVMRTIHGICLISYLFLFVITFLYSRTKFKANFLPYIAIFIALVLGAVIGIFINGKEQTTTFMVFLFAIPLLFTIKPLFASIVITISDIMYIILVLQMQTGLLRANNLSNALIFGAVSVVFSTYMMKVKIRGINNARKYKFLMENDQLTGLNNRLSFDSLLQQIKNYRENCTIIEFDINGLKEANDTKGHIAGDEIIVGAAECIRNTFNKYGNCFRIGGDEFVAVLDKPYEDETKLMNEFEENCKKWKGTLNPSLSISYGLVNLSQYKNNTLEEILATCDQLMYKNKSEYYIKSGKDRRKRSTEQ